MKQTFTVTGMSCAACQAHVENAVRPLQGVETVAVNLFQNYSTALYNPVSVYPSLNFQITKPADCPVQPAQFVFTSFTELKPKQFELNKEMFMHKTIEIRGMSCGHCAAHVERALNGLEGVRAKVNWNTKTAVLESGVEVADEVICTAVQDAGYEVVSIY